MEESTIISFQQTNDDKYAAERKAVKIKQLIPELQNQIII